MRKEPGSVATIVYSYYFIERRLLISQQILKNCDFIFLKCE
jgi:hypothetical protein